MAVGGGIVICMLSLPLRWASLSGSVGGASTVIR